MTEFVYIVHAGCIYEGGGVKEVFSNPESAKKYCEQFIAEENAQYEQWNKEEGSYEFELYAPTSDHEWQGSSDYIGFYKTEVKE
jgi:hypothetical protein